MGELDGFFPWPSTDPADGDPLLDALVAQREFGWPIPEKLTEAYQRWQIEQG